MKVFRAFIKLLKKGENKDLIFFSKRVKRSGTNFSNEVFGKLVFHLPYIVIFVKIVQKILNQTK